MAHLQLKPHVNSRAVMTCTVHGVMAGDLYSLHSVIQMSLDTNTLLLKFNLNHKRFTKNNQHLFLGFRGLFHHILPSNALLWCQLGFHNITQTSRSPILILLRDPDITPFCLDLCIVRRCKSVFYC